MLFKLINIFFVFLINKRILFIDKIYILKEKRIYKGNKSLCWTTLKVLGKKNLFNILINEN